MVSVVWANDFGEILPTLQQRSDLRERMTGLIAQDMPGKVTEGGDRKDQLRSILTDLFEGRLSLDESYREVSRQLPRMSSIHRGNNHVFNSGWEERQVRTQLSRFYNQAVLELLAADGQHRCFVHHSSAEDPATPCSINLAGREHDIAVLHERLVGNYTHGRWTRDLKLPNHPHCTHVVSPLLR